MSQKKKRDGPRIIAFDLEVIPDLMHGVLENWCALDAWPGRTLKADLTTICVFGYQILGEMDKPKTICAWDFKSRWNRDVNDDFLLVREARKILKTADVLITQNGKRFDFKHFQTRLFIHSTRNPGIKGFDALPKVQHVDSRDTMKSGLLLHSNSLKNGTKLFTPHMKKMDHGEGWDLWVKTYRKDKAAMKLMSDYCKQDVASTLELYLKLRPLGKGMVNHNLFRRDGVMACPECGSYDVTKNGWRYNTNMVYQRIVCKDCRFHFRVTKTGKTGPL